MTDDEIRETHNDIANASAVSVGIFPSNPSLSGAVALRIAAKAASDVGFIYHATRLSWLSLMASAFLSEAERCVADERVMRAVYENAHYEEWLEAVRTGGPWEWM